MYESFLELLKVIENLDPEQINQLYQMGQAVLTEGLKGLIPWLVTVNTTFGAVILLVVRQFLKHKKDMMDKDSTITESEANAKAAVEVGKEVAGKSLKAMEEIQVKYSNEIAEMKELYLLILKDVPMSADTLISVGKFVGNAKEIGISFAEKVQELIENKPEIDNTSYIDSLKE